MARFIVEFDGQYEYWHINNHALKALRSSIVLPDNEILTLKGGHEETLLLLEEAMKYRDPRWMEPSKERTNAISLMANVIYQLARGKSIMFDPNNLFIEPMTPEGIRAYIDKDTLRDIKCHNNKITLTVKPLDEEFPSSQDLKITISQNISLEDLNNSINQKINNFLESILGPIENMTYRIDLVATYKDGTFKYIIEDREFDKI